VKTDVGAVSLMSLFSPVLTWAGGERQRDAREETFSTASITMSSMLVPVTSAAAVAAVATIGPTSVQPIPGDLRGLPGPRGVASPCRKG
jgi:hypothetical protein